MLTYKEKSTLGRGNYIEVKKMRKHPHTGRPMPITIGRIHETGSGQFAYFQPETNELNPKFVEDTLAELKRKIEALHK